MDSMLNFNFSKHFHFEVNAILAKKSVIPTELSHVEKINYFHQKNGIRSKEIGIPFQTHSKNCKIIKDAGYFENTDGLITTNDNLILSLSVADCCPVYIYDNKLKIKGLIHSGWKGTVNEISIVALQKFKELGSDFSNLKIFLGPSIGSCCYEVQNDVAELFNNNCKVNINGNKFKINLKKQIQQDLIRVGITKKQILLSEICTFENDYCESYRRDKESSGRMIALFGDLKI